MTQTTIREFWVSDNMEDAVRKTKLTLKKLGTLDAVVPGQHVVGTVAFGVEHVSLKIAWRTEEWEAKVDQMVGKNAPAKTIGTLLVMEASHDVRAMNGSDGALRNAFERFEDAYLHFDRSDYSPDRVGLLPATIIGIVVLLTLIGVLLARQTGFFKPAPTPSASASATAP